MVMQIPSPACHPLHSRQAAQRSSRSASRRRASPDPGQCQPQRRHQPPHPGLCTRRPALLQHLSLEPSVQHNSTLRHMRPARPAQSLPRVTPPPCPPARQPQPSPVPDTIRPCPGYQAASRQLRHSLSLPTAAFQVLQLPRLLPSCSCPTWLRGLMWRPPQQQHQHLQLRCCRSLALTAMLGSPAKHPLRVLLARWLPGPLSAWRQHQGSLPAAMQAPVEQKQQASLLPLACKQPRATTPKRTPTPRISQLWRTRVQLHEGMWRALILQQTRGLAWL